MTDWACSRGMLLWRISRRSANSRSPLWRTRMRSGLRTPGTLATASSMRRVVPAGAASTNASKVRLPRRKLIYAIIPATASAATGSALRSQGMFRCSAMDKQPAGSFEDDPGAGREQQRGFNEGRKGLDLPVAKRVRQVGGLIRLANRKVSDDSGHQIEARMRRLGKNPQALRHQSHDDLDGDQKHRGQDGGERGRLFLPKPWGAMHDKIISPRSALALKRRSVS